MWLAGNSASARLSAKRVVRSGSAALVKAAAAEEDPPPATPPDELDMPLLSVTGGGGAGAGLQLVASLGAQPIQGSRPPRAVGSSASRLSTT
jgi:hypothetical protein